MTSDKPRSDRCAAECRDGGYCTQYPVQGANRCRMHGGTNQGAPEGNDNAVRHELYAAENTYYQRRSETAQAFIDETFEGYYEKWCRLKADPPTRGDEAMLFRCAIDIHKIVFKADEWEAVKPDQLESGHPMVDRSEKRSPQGQTYFEYIEQAVHRAQHRLQQRTRMWLKDNDLIDSPESQQAAATLTLAEVVNGE